MKFTPRFAAGAGAVAVGLATVGTAVAVQASPPAPATTAQLQTRAASTAAAFLSGQPAVVHPSADDAYVQHKVITSGRMQYVPYDRTYKGLPVVGGDFVVVTDDTATITNVSVAQQRAIGNLSVTPTLTATAAEAVARGQVANVSGVEDTHLVVYALDAGAARLAWETTVDGTDAEGSSRLSVDVDARSGAVLHTQEHVLHGTGTAAYNGPNPVQLDTTHSGSTYSLTDPNIRNLSCQDYTTHATLTGSDDSWGNGDATNKETGCVDALFVAQTEAKMLADWFGRDGMDGNGGAWPIRVGWDNENAQYTGTTVDIGHNAAGQWIGVNDVLGHEMGHGVDDNTPGGISGRGTQEFVADTFGAETEWYANEPSPYDTPDFQVGEEVNLVGSGPIRYMYNPSLVGDDNCFSNRTALEEVHAAAGPGNHWFYLVAEGTNPTNGQPTSPTCNNSSVSGLGIENAGKIMYNAMLMKTSASSYPNYRVWTLQAAKNLTPGDCTAFNTVKAAWDAVSVPAQSGETTCTPGTPTSSPTPTPTSSPTPTPTPPPGGGCSGQLLGNPGFESGNTVWTASTSVIGQNASLGEPARTGTWDAYLDGYGRTHTDTLSQSVVIPAGCRATLSFYVHIDTNERSSTTAFDTLTVALGGTTLGTLSNLDAATGYVPVSYDVGSFAGRTVTLTFTGTEDTLLQTSFVIDDTALTVG